MGDGVSIASSSFGTPAHRPLHGDAIERGPESSVPRKVHMTVNIRDLFLGSTSTSGSAPPPPLPAPSSVATAARPAGVAHAKADASSTAAKAVGTPPPSMASSSSSFAGGHGTYTTPSLPSLARSQQAFVAPRRFGLAGLKAHVAQSQTQPSSEEEQQQQQQQRHDDAENRAGTLNVAPSRSQEKLKTDVPSTPATTSAHTTTTTTTAAPTPAGPPAGQKDMADEDGRPRPPPSASRRSIPSSFSSSTAAASRFTSQMQLQRDDGKHNDDAKPKANATKGEVDNKEVEEDDDDVSIELPRRATHSPLAKDGDVLEPDGISPMSTLAATPRPVPLPSRSSAVNVNEAKHQSLRESGIRESGEEEDRARSKERHPPPVPAHRAQVPSRPSLLQPRTASSQRSDGPLPTSHELSSHEKEPILKNYLATPAPTTTMPASSSLMDHQQPSRAPLASLPLPQTPSLASGSNGGNSEGRGGRHGAQPHFDALHAMQRPAPSLAYQPPPAHIQHSTRPSAAHAHVHALHTSSSASYASTPHHQMQPQHLQARHYQHSSHPSQPVFGTAAAGAPPPPRASVPGTPFDIYQPSVTAPSTEHDGNGPIQGPPPSAHGNDAITNARKPPFYVNGVPYTRITQIGKGGSSRVYKVIASNGQLFALKKVSLKNADQDTITGYLDEVRLLHKMRKNERIIRMVDHEHDQAAKTLCVVMELGEIDLANLIMRYEREGRSASTNGQSSSNSSSNSSSSSRGSHANNINMNNVRVWWEQMLEAVQAIHELRVVHSDLKPANFLFVEGKLKLIDFGIARAINNDTTNIHRDHQVGTINFMSPEALTDTNSKGSGTQCMKLARSSDIWSLGCILYQLIYGRPPFSHINGMMQKVRCILDPTYPIEYPPIENQWLLECLKGCLQRDPHKRLTIPELLEHPFLRPDREQWGSLSSEGIQTGGYPLLTPSVAERILRIMPFILQDAPLPPSLTEQGFDRHRLPHLEKSFETLYRQLRRDGKI